MSSRITRKSAWKKCADTIKIVVVQALAWMTPMRPRLKFRKALDDTNTNTSESNAASLWHQRVGVREKKTPIFRLEKRGNQRRPVRQENWLICLYLVSEMRLVSMIGVKWAKWGCAFPAKSKKRTTKPSKVMILWLFLLSCVTNLDACRK